MIMIYSMLDRNQIFASDPQFSKVSNNDKTVYKYRTWKEYGYIDYITYADYLQKLTNDGVIDEETRSKVATIGRKADSDKDEVKQYVEEFEAYCKANGYTVIRLDAIMQTPRKVAPGGQAKLFAYRDRPLYLRLVNYFSHLVTVDNIHAVEEDVGERGLTYTLHDPLYGGEKFSPAILGNGTSHKYLLYCDGQFPFVHQNLFSINLGKSYSVNKNIEVTTTMTRSQGSFVSKPVTYPTGLVEVSADDLHTAIYQSGSLEGNAINKERFVDNYTSVQTNKSGMSRMGYSFTIGIIAVALAYLLGVPLGILVALKKDKLVDKIGTAYIVFIMAVPSLSYILIFKALGNMAGLPTTFIMDSTSKLMFVLPIISLRNKSRHPCYSDRYDPVRMRAGGSDRTWRQPGHDRARQYHHGSDRTASAVDGHHRIRHRRHGPYAADQLRGALRVSWRCRPCRTCRRRRYSRMLRADDRIRSHEL